MINRRDFIKASALSLTSINPLKALYSQSKAKSLVHIFYVGGPSQIELFDYKPDLYKYHNKTINHFKSEKGQKGGTLKKPISTFKKAGNSGMWLSDLIPHMHKHADDLTLIKTVQAQSLNHIFAQNELLTGSIFADTSSFGSWINYLRGEKNSFIPQELILPDALGAPRCSPQCFSTQLEFNRSFLEFEDFKALQSLYLRSHFKKKDEINTFSHYLKKFNQNSGHLQRRDQIRRHQELEFQLKSFHQLNEFLKGTPSQREQKLYNIKKYGENALADKLLFTKYSLKKGAPFVQIMIGNEDDPTSWDHHFNMNDILTMTKKSDFLISAFLSDIKEEGLSEDTIILGAGEFGRTPITDEGLDKPKGISTWGRGHNKYLNSVWLMAPGLKKGFTYGESDNLSLFCDQNPVSIADLWYTLFHLLGIDGHKVESIKKGRILRPNFKHGNLVREILS